MWAYILAHENAVPLWRSLMGPTKVFRARHSDPDSIRGAYGLTDTRNTTHGSGRSSILGCRGGRIDGALSAFGLVLGLQVNNFFPSPCTRGQVQPSQVPLESSTRLWWQTGIALSLPFLLFDRLTCLSQQRNCLFLPRVRRAALVRAGRAAAAARAALLQRRGAHAPRAGGTAGRGDLS